MAVFSNIVSFVLMVALVLAAYFVISFQQTEHFGQQSDQAQTVFYEHKVSEDTAAILKAKEPASGMSLSELIAYYVYYKQPAFKTEFTQVNIVPTVKRAFDAVYGEQNYYFEVEPKDVDLRMLFLVDGSKSLRDDLNRLSLVLPNFVDSFSGTGLNVAAEVFIIVSDDAGDPEEINCSEFDWNAASSVILCHDRNTMMSGDSDAINMANVYSDFHFASVKDIPRSSYEDWASATAWKALQINDSPLTAYTLFFPISDELSTGSEPDLCLDPPVKNCETLYSSKCCRNVQTSWEGYKYCSSSWWADDQIHTPECDELRNNPEKCGTNDQSISIGSNILIPNVYSCWMDQQAIDGPQHMHQRCADFKDYCSVCGERDFVAPADYNCGSVRSAQSVENAIHVIQDLKRNDFYIFPIRTNPDYPYSTYSVWGYRPWCIKDSGDLGRCCERPQICNANGYNCCSACQANASKVASLRGYCDETFTIDGNTVPANSLGDPNQNDDIIQQMDFLSKSANPAGRLVNLRGDFNVALFQQELRNMIFTITDTNFRIGTMKPNEERYVSETLIPLPNGKLTQARFWLYKNRSPHLIQDVNADISRVNYPPEAKFIVSPMPYCGNSPTCDVTFDARQSSDPNESDPTFGENLSVEWDVVPTDDSTTDVANSSGHNKDWQFTTPLPSNAANKRYYNIKATVTDSQGATNSAELNDYCVGSGCKPSMLYMFMPIKWTGTFEQYREFAALDCTQIKNSMPCDASKIACKCVGSSNGAAAVVDCMDTTVPDGSVKFSCDSVPMVTGSGPACIALAGETLDAATDCTLTAGMDDPSVDWAAHKRVLGLISPSISICGGAVGFTMRFGTTAADMPDYYYVAVHELGHTYGFCDEYLYAYWLGQNAGSPCPNPWQLFGFYGDTCDVAGTPACRSAMGGAYTGPPPWGPVWYRDYDTKPDHTVQFPYSLGDSDKNHVKSFVGC